MHIALSLTDGLSLTLRVVNDLVNATARRMPLRIADVPAALLLVESLWHWASRLPVPR